jgi:hypothetical protein
MIPTYWPRNPCMLTMTEIKLHHNNMNTKDESSLSRTYKPCIHALKDWNKMLSTKKHTLPRNPNLHPEKDCLSSLSQPSVYLQWP